MWRGSRTQGLLLGHQEFLGMTELTGSVSGSSYPKWGHGILRYVHMTCWCILSSEKSYKNAKMYFEFQNGIKKNTNVDVLWCILSSNIFRNGIKYKYKHPGWEWIQLATSSFFRGSTLGPDDHRQQRLNKTGPRFSLHGNFLLDPLSICNFQFLMAVMDRTRIWDWRSWLPRVPDESVDDKTT